jgi:hypothetical protein
LSRRTGSIALLGFLDVVDGRESTSETEVRRREVVGRTDPRLFAGTRQPIGERITPIASSCSFDSHRPRSKGRHGAARGYAARFRDVAAVRIRSRSIPRIPSGLAIARQSGASHTNGSRLAASRAISVS